MKIRRSRVFYRTKKGRAGHPLKKYASLLLIVGAVLLAAVLTVLWGTLWGEQAEQSAARRVAAREEAAALAANTPEWLPIPPAPIQAAYLGKITSLDDALTNAVILTEDGAKALSLPLYTEDGLHYSSDTAQILGLQTAGASDVTLSRLFSTLRAEDAYLAATFSCQWQGERDTALRRIRRAYEAAFVAEIAQGGADEVLLLDLTVDEQTLPEVALFLREVRENCPEAVIGVAVSVSLMTEEHYVERMRTLLTWADHIALHLGDHQSLTMYREGEDGSYDRTTATVAQTLELLDFAIERYRMRLLLPTSMYEHLEVIEELGYDNWQIVR